MDGIREALSEISSLRHAVARSTQFRGYGPLSVSFSGLLAFAAAALQTTLLAGSERHAGVCIVLWTAVAGLALGVSAFETLVRSRRVHDGLAREMLRSAVEQFMPALVIGMLLTAVLKKTAPQEYWLLPGLWELMFSLGIFASCRFLPRQMFAVGVWYLATGLFSLVLCAGTRTFLPWAMGLSFGVGQLLVAAVLQFGFEDTLE